MVAFITCVLLLKSGMLIYRQIMELLLALLNIGPTYWEHSINSSTVVVWLFIMQQNMNKQWILVGC